MFFILQNRFYIETKLKTDLNVELRKLFVVHVADRHVPLLIRKSFALHLKFKRNLVLMLKTPCNGTLMFQYFFNFQEVKNIVHLLPSAIEK